MSTAALAQSLLNRLALAGIYILIALGLTLVMSIMGIVQVAHGEIYMIGAYVVYHSRRPRRQLLFRHRRLHPLRRISRGRH